MAAAVVASVQHTHCGFCRDQIQDGAVQYVEQAMCKKILFWLSDIDSKFDAFDVQQISSTWCQVCFGISAIMLQNLYNLGERLSPRLASSQTSSSRAQTGSLKQEHRNSIAGNEGRTIQFHATSVPSTTVFQAVAQTSLAATHPTQFIAGAGMKTTATPAAHMGMTSPGMPILAAGGAGGLGMVAPMMHAPHLQTLAVNGLPCQPFYARPDLMGHTPRAPSAASPEKQEKQELEQGEKTPKQKKPRKKKDELPGTAGGVQVAPEAFSPEFEGNWNDASNFTNIAHSFGLIAKSEESPGGATESGLLIDGSKLMDANMASTGTTPSNKKGKKEGMKLHKCFACDKQFTSQKWLRKHMEEKHNIVATFNCETCGKKFNDRKNFRRHCRLHSEDTPYKCSICGKKCGRNKDLRNHMSSHQSERNFQCTVCGKGYKAMKALRDHMKVHDGIPVTEANQMQRETLTATPLVAGGQGGGSGIAAAAATSTQPASLPQDLLDQAAVSAPQLAMSLQNQVLMDPHAITTHALLQQRYAETFRTTNLADLGTTVVALHTPLPQNPTDSHR